MTPAAIDGCSSQPLELLDDMKQRWLASQPDRRPQAKDYEDRLEGPDAAHWLLALIGLERKLRRESRDDELPLEHYLEQFPDIRPFLELALGLQQDLSNAGGMLSATPSAATCPDQGSELDFGAYELLDRLGSGGMGEVYLSRDPRLDCPLGLKVLRAEWLWNAEMEQRFKAEAHITGSLQHPGIVPVHNIGRLRDGRLYFTMRWVRGRTLAELLAEGGGVERLRIFEQICHAVAYAHSKGVIHRDLKPENVMVGCFGEVQVVDWGLAKVLTPDGTGIGEPPAGASDLIIRRTESADWQTQGALGTRAYMAPEQANGEWQRVDKRVDVFGLGGILCAILTGRPPYVGTTPEEVLGKAQRGDLAEAFARLDDCGADSALVELAKECLCPQMAGRPRDAGGVAGRIEAHLEAVQQRLRAAEVERAAASARAQEAQARLAAETQAREAAQACAEEARARQAAETLARQAAEAQTAEARAKAAAERRARLLLLGFTLAGLLLLAGFWKVQLDRATARSHQLQVDQDVLGVCEPARLLLDRAWDAHDLAGLIQARAEAERAVGMATSGGASPAEQAQAATLQSAAAERVSRARKNRALLDALVDVSMPGDTHVYEDDGSGRVVALPRPGVARQYADAFQRWGLDIDRTPEAEVVARLQQEPAPVVQEVVAALDHWWLEGRWRRRRQTDWHPEPEWLHLCRIADRLDRNDRSRQLRALLVGGAEPRAASVAGLVGGQPAWPALWEMARGNPWRRLQNLREQADPASEPALTVVLLAWASLNLGDTAGAEQVLRRAVEARPDQVVLLAALGRTLEKQNRLGEAIECYRAIRTRRPHLGVALATTLLRASRPAHAEAVLRDLVRRQPNNPEVHVSLGLALAEQKKLIEAVGVYRKAIDLNPDLASTHNNLGLALDGQKKRVEAVAAYRKAIDLDPGHSWAYNNLGVTLRKQKKLMEAVAAYRKAIAIRPELSEAWYNLGNALSEQRKLDEAVAAYHKSIELEPGYHRAHNNLGATLGMQNKLQESVAACRKAIELRPDQAEPFNNLGTALRHLKKLDEAAAAYRAAIARKPDLASAHFHLGETLLQQQKFQEAAAAYRETIHHEPGHREAHYNLGQALYAQKKWDEAEAAFRGAAQLKPDDGLARAHLGAVLLNQLKLNEAVIACRQAIALGTAHAGVHVNLGLALWRLARFKEALAELQQAVGLLSAGNPRRAEAQELVHRCERLVILDGRLPAILKGTDKPGSPTEQIELAGLCQLKELPAAAARFGRHAFAAAPHLAETVASGNRYNAACCAALAGCGQGKDAIDLDAGERTVWRRQALAWLRADLACWKKRYENGNGQVKVAVQKQLQGWQTHHDFSGVRDEAALARLPEAERIQWQQLWADVAGLIGRAAR